MTEEFAYRQSIIEYYKICWLERFKNGHNPISLAMHLGFFNSPDQSNDIAKVQMNEFLVKQLQFNEADNFTVVDAGCGIGGTLFYLSKLYPKLNLIGINISQDQIEFAENQLLSGLNINFLCEDYANTSIADASVNVVYAIESVCHATSKADFFAEVFRILKPGGKFLVLDYVQTGLPNDKNTMQLLEHFQAGWAVNQYLLKPEIEVREAGFTDIQSVALNQKVLPGIHKSYTGAVEKIKSLNGHANVIVKNHLLACKALNELINKSVIEYKMLFCIKP